LYAAIAIGLYLDQPGRLSHLWLGAKVSTWKDGDPGISSEEES